MGAEGAGEVASESLEYSSLDSPGLLARSSLGWEKDLWMGRWGGGCWDWKEEEAVVVEERSRDEDAELGS